MDYLLKPTIMENNRNENDHSNEIRKPATDISKGANETDQLEKLKPKTEEEKNKRSDQAGASPSCKESPQGGYGGEAEIPSTYTK